MESSFVLTVDPPVAAKAAVTSLGTVASVVVADPSPLVALVASKFPAADKTVVKISSLDPADVVETDGGTPVVAFPDVADRAASLVLVTVEEVSDEVGSLILALDATVADDIVVGLVVDSPAMVTVGTSKPLTTGDVAVEIRSTDVDSEGDVSA